MKSSEHYSEDELAQYALDPATFDEPREVEAHLAGCAACREQLARIERIDGGMQKRIVWDICDDITTEAPETPPDALRARVKTMDEERRGARAALEPLLVSPARFRDAKLERDERFQTTKAVAVLYETAKELHEQQPQFALLLANAAVAIATKLASTGELRSTLHLGRAYLERGRTLFLIGRYKDAEQALDNAERTYGEDENATEWDKATVWLVRANIYVESERLDQAAIPTAAAAQQFQIFGDVERYLHAQLLLGSVLLMEGDYRASAEAVEQIVRQARMRGDTPLLAKALQNSGEAYLLLHEYERAVPCYVEAHAIWEELGREVERVRTNWSLATVDVDTGHIDNGISRLEETYRAFEALGVVNDAALARMQLGETLLRAGRPDEVSELLRDVVVTFAAEGMMRNARIALAYLKEAIEQKRVSPELIRHVRKYIEHLPFRASAPFVPLQ